MRMKAVAIVLLAALPAWAGGGAKETDRNDDADYAAVLLGGKKIGYVRTVRTAGETKVTHEMRMDVALGRAGTPLRIRVDVKTVETPDGRPLAFHVKQDAAIMTMEVDGTVKPDGTMVLKSTTAGRTTTRPATWPKGAVMEEGLRLLTRKQGLKEGASLTATVFDPTTLRGMKTTVRVGKKKKVDLLGRVVTLTEVKTTMATAVGEVTETSYVDADREPLKTLLPLMGMTLEVIACDRRFALSDNDPTDFFSQALVASPRPLKGLDKAEAMAFHLRPKGKAKLNVPALDGQSVRKGGGGELIVTVRRLRPPAGQPMPYRGKDKSARAALKPNRVLQSDREEVAALARQAVGDAKDAATAARRVRDFVHKYITKKSLAVGYATAAEVAVSKEGDCSEHAVLAAAMCRSTGIPAEVVYGVMYVGQLADRQDVFGPHAWFRVYVGGKWIQMDAAPARGWDVSHIALGTGDGEMAGFFALVNTLGCFTITKVTDVSGE